LVSEALRGYKHNWYVKHREECLSRSAEWHKNHPKETMVASLKWNHNNRDKCNRNLRRYYQRHSAEMLEKDRMERKLFPEKAHAHDIARKFPLADSCEFCDVMERLERHHPDYSYPEIFMTVCKDCHAVVDKEVLNLEVYDLVRVDC
jgi:hypothetical protein